MRTFFVYILSNDTNTTLYIGMTNDLGRRVSEHRVATSGFTARYRVHKLVYYEEYPTALDAITREKQLKKRSRNKKIELIENMNPQWKDLGGTKK